MSSEFEPFSKPETHQVGGRVVTSAFLLWLTTALTRIAQLLTTVVLARVLSPDDFGIVALATTVVGVVSIVSDLQVSNAIIKAKSLSRAHFDTAFTISLLRGVGISLLIFLSSGFLARAFGDQRLEAVLCAMAVPILLGCLNNPFLSFYARELDFKRESKRQVASAVVGAAAGLASVLLLRSYWAIVISTVASSAAMLVLSYCKIPWRPRLGLSKAREMVSFGVWLVLVGILDFLNGRIDYLLIGKRLGNQTLGAYHLGQQVAILTTGDVVAPLSRALFPAFSMMSNDINRLRRAYLEAQTVTLTLALPIGFGMSAIAKEVVYLLLGPQWAISAIVVTYIAPLIALQTMLAGIEMVALTMDRGRDLFFRSATFLLFRVLVLVICFYFWGFMGIVLGRVLTGSFFLVYGLQLAAKITRGRLLDPIVTGWRSVVSVALMYGSLMVVPSIQLEGLDSALLLAGLTGKIFLGAAVYVISNSVLWIASGCPRGAERRILDQVVRLLHRFAAVVGR